MGKTNKKTLSDKQQDLRDCKSTFKVDILFSEDVKEFIKQLKFQLKYHYETHKRYGKMTQESEMRFNDLKTDIDKLAGEKLI